MSFTTIMNITKNLYVPGQNAILNVQKFHNLANWLNIENATLATQE